MSGTWEQLQDDEIAAATLAYLDALVLSAEGSNSGGVASITRDETGTPSALFTVCKVGERWFAVSVDELDDAASVRWACRPVEAS